MLDHIFYLFPRASLISRIEYELNILNILESDLIKDEKKDGKNTLVDEQK